MLVRESISFERGGDPKKILGIGSPNVGDVYKHIWPWDVTQYYMILSGKNIDSDNKISYSTTILGNYDTKWHKWEVPYKSNPNEKMGSQRGGMWYVKKYDEHDSILIPIDEKDKKKLIRYFSKPRNLSYLQEIKEEDEIVPYFLEDLLTNI